MATRMTANGVSTTTTPGTEQYEVFYTTPATAHGERNTTNMITATLTENYIPVWQILSKSADNAVMNGGQKRNNISQVVILTERSDLVMKSLRFLPKISEVVAELPFKK
jgi:hypothetical protein